MAKYFKKEVPSRPLYLPIGKPIEFEHYDDDYGYLKTEDGYIIDQLYQCISNSSGGVSEVTEEEYMEWLKKKSNTNFSPNLRRRETIGPASRRRPSGVAPHAVTSDQLQTIIGTSNNSPVSDVANPQKSDGLKVERTFVKPRLGKLND